MGFDTYTGDYHEIKRLLSMMGVDFTLLSDASAIFDSPNTGEYKLYPGGTPLEDAMDSINAAANSRAAAVFDDEDDGLYPEGMEPEGAGASSHRSKEH